MATIISRLGGRASRRRVGTTDPGFDRRLLTPMILGAVLNPVNSSIIAVSLVPIGRALGEPPSQTAWLVSALYLATSIGQPVAGRLVDLFGPRRVYLVGASLAGLAGLLGTLAPNLGFLVAARVLLGFGTCAGYPAAMYLIRSEARRTGHDSPAAVLTTLAVSAQTIAVIGPTLGGLLIGLGGWRTTFAVNVPLALACLVLGARRLPRAAPPAPASAGNPPRADLDLPGIGLFAAMLTSLLLFLMNPHPGRWYLPLITLVAGAGFVLRERSQSAPFIDLRVLAGNRPLLVTYLRTLLSFVVSYTFLYGFTQWLEDGRGLGATQAGLVLLPMFATAIGVSVTTGRRPQVKGKLVVGALGQIAGCAMLLLLAGQSAIWLIVAVAVVVGIPQGLLSLANQNAVYHQAVPERLGSSAGLLRTFTYLGAIVASAANGTFLAHGASTDGLHHLAVFVLAIAGLLLVVTLLDRSLRQVGAPRDSTDRATTA
jgi:MFS family permease